MSVENNLEGPVEQDPARRARQAALDQLRRRQWWQATLKVFVLFSALMACNLFLPIAMPYASFTFLGTPFLVGFFAAFFMRKSAYPPSILRGTDVAIAGCFMTTGFLLFTEGGVCVVMAMPLLPIPVLFGAVLGNSVWRHSYAAHAVTLPVLLWAVFDTVAFAPSPLHTVSVLEIDAPPLEVWQHVIEFPEIDRQEEPSSYLLGYPQPRRAFMDGEGVGAIRHCVFDQGEFIEPIEVWRPGVELSFGCTSQPQRLGGYLVVTRGQFLLEALPNNRTRITGTTWYDLHCQPTWYFGAICQWIIGDIHDDVLANIRRLAESR
ncbi:MAG: hypothetical protein AAF581_22975 [Planctomycetota bacterium]